MRSATKRDVGGEEIAALLRAALGPGAEPRDHVELTDGWFASVYAVTMADGRELVLKIPPAPEVPVLRYEFDLLRTEIEFYRLAGAAGVPVPTVVAADPDRGYLLTERLRGRLLTSVRKTLPAAKLTTVRGELGAIAARLRTVTGELFGYPRADGRTRSTSWRTSFLSFVDDVLADAVTFGAELPARPETIRTVIGRHAPLLDEVTTPVLVHFDLFDSNVFVVSDMDSTTGVDTLAVEGVIDGERAFYGDPIAELIALARFADPAEVPGLLPTFLGRPLTGGERTRLRLYTCYLFLIMAVEAIPRAFDPAEHEPFRQLALSGLDAELSGL